MAPKTAEPKKLALLMAGKWPTLVDKSISIIQVHHPLKQLPSMVRNILLSSPSVNLVIVPDVTWIDKEYPPKRAAFFLYELARRFRDISITVLVCTFINASLTPSLIEFNDEALNTYYDLFVDTEWYLKKLPVTVGVKIFNDKLLASLFAEMIKDLKSKIEIGTSLVEMMEEEEGEVVVENKRGIVLLADHTNKLHHKSNQLEILKGKKPVEKKKTPKKQKAFEKENQSEKDKANTSLFFSNETFEYYPQNNRPLSVWAKRMKIDKITIFLNGQWPVLDREKTSMNIITGAYNLNDMLHVITQLKVHTYSKRLLITPSQKWFKASITDTKSPAKVAGELFSFIKKQKKDYNLDVIVLGIVQPMIPGASGMEDILKEGKKLDRNVFKDLSRYLPSDKKLCEVGPRDVQRAFRKALHDLK